MTGSTSEVDAPPQFQYGIVLSYSDHDKSLQVALLEADGRPSEDEVIKVSYYDWILLTETGRQPSRNYAPDPFTGWYDMKRRGFSPPTAGQLIMIYVSASTRRIYWTRPNAILRWYPRLGQTVPRIDDELPSDLVAILDLAQLTVDQLRSIRDAKRHHFEFGPRVVYFGPDPIDYVNGRGPGFRYIGLRWDPTIGSSGEVRRILDPEFPPRP